jgi:hypothetical protein
MRRMRADQSNRADLISRGALAPGFETGSTNNSLRFVKTPFPIHVRDHPLKFASSAFYSGSIG